MKEDPEFKAAVEEVQEYTVDVAESELHKLIKAGETTAIIFYLKTKGKKRGYVERQELVGAEGKDLFASKSDSELLSMMSELMQKLNGSQANNPGDTSSAGTSEA